MCLCFKKNAEDVSITEVEIEYVYQRWWGIGEKGDGQSKSMGTVSQVLRKGIFSSTSQQNDCS